MGKDARKEEKMDGTKRAMSEIKTNYKSITYIKLETKLVYTPVNKVNCFIKNMKDKIEKCRRTINKIVCAACKEIYVGHTGAGMKLECIITKYGGGRKK